MWSVCLCLSNRICVVTSSVTYLPFPVCTQTKLCIISKRPIYANTPLRALCFSRPFLSRFPVGCLSLLLDAAELPGVHPSSLILRSGLPCEGEQKWQAVLKWACRTFKVFGIVLMSCYLPYFMEDGASAAIQGIVFATAATLLNCLQYSSCTD